jgi:hypothetical protein
VVLCGTIFVFQITAQIVRGWADQPAKMAAISHVCRVKGRERKMTLLEIILASLLVGSQIMIWRWYWEDYHSLPSVMDLLDFMFQIVIWPAVPIIVLWRYVKNNNAYLARKR